MCTTLHMHLSCHQRVPNIDTVALYYEQARDTHYDSNAYYCLYLLIISFFCQGRCILNTNTTNKLHLTKNDVQPIFLWRVHNGRPQSGKYLCKRSLQQFLLYKAFPMREAKVSCGSTPRPTYTLVSLLV
jgi:hypothetical protein